MQSGSSGSHGSSSKTIPLRAEPAAVETAPPFEGTAGPARAAVVVGERVEI